MKKLTIILLVVVFLFAEVIMASCANGNQSADTTKNADVTTVTTDTEKVTDTEKYPDPVPELDLGGQTVTFLVRGKD